MPVNYHQAYVGFDLGVDDVAMVVLHRVQGGYWRVESAEGPDAKELAAAVAAAVSAWPPAPAMPDVVKNLRPLADDVREWLDRYGPEDFHVDEEQMRLLSAAFAWHMASGQICHGTNATPNGDWAWADSRNARRLGRGPEFDRYYLDEPVKAADPPADSRP